MAAHPNCELPPYRHLLLWAEDSQADLRAEVAWAFPGAAIELVRERLLVLNPEPSDRHWPHLAFARQWLPFARCFRAQSVSAWVKILADSVIGVLPDDSPWSLHVEPHYGESSPHRIGARAWHTLKQQGLRPGETPGLAAVRQAFEPEAGRHRCLIVRESLLDLLRRKRRHLLRRLRPTPTAFTPGDSLVQLLLLSPDTGFLSVAVAPLPYAERHLVSPFPKGMVAVASDKAAPSRAFAKLVEAEQRLGQGIAAGETCVDLGAAPGSWTYVAACRGARVTAVDRSPLHKQLMRNPLVRFEETDAFQFQPPGAVDWLLCDVIAPPDRTAALLLDWLHRGWCRRFVVTLKLKDDQGVAPLQRLKAELPVLTREFRLLRLNANKKEVTAFGVGLGAEEACEASLPQ